MKSKILLFSFILISAIASAQTRDVSGTVSDRGDGSPIAGANITVKGTGTGTSTDANGKFSLKVSNDVTTLIVSFIGFETQEVNITGQSTISISLDASASQLEEVVISTGRGSQRTITDTPLPIDNFAASDLKTTGQVTFDKALQYRVPSFNTVNTPVNDATSLFDPYEIRNLGPSRTLILINGKRKNFTSLIYTQTSPARGETGADLSAIPVDAIKRVEILRDGASAQYGSDAIAGVVNIILKDSYEGSSASVTTGSTLHYGGFQYGFNFNTGANFANKGYINYHLSFNHNDQAIRKDKIDPTADYGFTDGSAFSISQVDKFLKKYPDGLNKNGTPENTSMKFLVNGAIPVGVNSEVYFNAATVFRKSLSNANYRQPYWRVDELLLHTVDPSAPDYTAAPSTYGDPGSVLFNDVQADQAAGKYKGYIGYQPSMEGDLADYNGTLGFRSQDIGGWKQDMSLTVGGNKMLFSVDNTVNRTLLKGSPISFKPGGFSFNHIVGNMDFSRTIGDKVYLGLGSEFRTESWELIAGDTASYSGDGANSFYGYLQKNAIKATRTNLGVYADITVDFTENFLIGGTFRHETYSDFGNADVYKFTSRYKFGEVATIRGSYSTGFRAPSLHQKYSSLSQASFSGGDIVITGLANNLSREAQAVGVPKLKAEESQNLTFGFGLTPSKNLSFTFDYYLIKIDNRIVYSNEVNYTAGNVVSTSFFLNAAKTETSGLDLVATYRNLSLGGSSKLNINLAGNYRITNKIVGGYKAVNDAVPLNLDPGEEIFSKTNESLMTTSRPLYKFILGFDVFAGKWSFNQNNTLFGPTTYNNADLSSDLKVVFKPKVVPDLSITYTANPKLGITFTVQNISNVMPEYEIKALNSAGEAILGDPAAVKDQINAITFAGRYPILTYEGSHFSQMGTTYLVQLNCKF